MANPLRGEIKIKLGASTHTVCLTFKEILHLEELLAEGIFEIAKKFSENKVGIKEVSAVIFCGLGGKMNLEQVGIEITNDGAATHLSTAIELLTRALGGK